MARNLIICLDGTWNTYKDHTNVSRLHALLPVFNEPIGERAQIKYYDEGVGTGRFERIRGGLLGWGLKKNILQAYAWLVRNYQKDDQLFVFGFSRGAYTARSLAGLIRRCGIADSPGPNAISKITEDAYDIYHRNPKDNEEALTFRRVQSREARIRFLGVWDTVGAVGLSSVNFAEKFHDTELGDNVDYAYQALAIDEHRKPYEAILWTANPGNAVVEQRWFPGAHANVGGGYEDDLLPDIPLKWMLGKALGCGLYLGSRDEKVLTLDDVLPLDGNEFRSPVRDSYHEFIGGLYRLVTLENRHYRPIGAGLYESVDASAFLKWEQDSNYRPFNLAHAEAGVGQPSLAIAMAE